MNREIKFRGKRIDTGEWVYGDLIENQGRYYIYYATSDTTLENEDNSIIVLAEEVDLDTVGQYTGLKDRNGKEIYEGDIVSAWSAGSHCPNGIIKWGKGSCAFFIGNSKNSLIWHISGDKGRETLEVIGNRWDNPELLEDGK